MGTTIITVPKLSQRIRLARIEHQYRAPEYEEEPLFDPEEEARREEERYRQQILEDDMKAAYERGVQDGRDIASGMYEHEMRQHQEWLRNFDGVAANLQADFISAVQQMEDSVIKLATLLAEQILHYEAETSTKIVIEQARKAFRRLQGVDHVEIHIHPDNYLALETAKSDLLLEARAVRTVHVVADQSVERGGCVLYTRLGMIDARLTTQLGNLLEQILATRQEFEDTKAQVPQSDAFSDDEIFRQTMPGRSEQFGNQGYSVDQFSEYGESSSAQQWQTQEQSIPNNIDFDTPDMNSPQAENFSFEDLSTLSNTTDDTSSIGNNASDADDDLSWLFENNEPSPEA